MADDTKLWQRGFPLAELRAVTDDFAAWDDGLVLGAFTRVKENAVAAARADGKLLSIGQSHAIHHTVGRPLPIKDFTGAERLVAPAGTLVVDRFCGPDAVTALVRDARHRPVVVHGWIEHPRDSDILTSLGLRLAAAKIRASSELIGVWHRGCYLGQPIADADTWALRPAPGLPSPVTPNQAREELDAAAVEFADHYSSYNARHSWQAFALRSFGGDPLFIEKPAEMSRKWKHEHPDALAWDCEWTPAADRLPSLRALAESLPAPVERVRVMRLRAGDGELTRHADITDRSAGTAPGCLLRLHWPITTNPDVTFTAWTLTGEQQREHFAAGKWWYLDTRKPHACVNAGETDRIHLVVDAWSTPELLDALR